MSNVTRHADGTSTWKCQKCSREVTRWPGSANAECDCGAQYNCFGQRLRDDWRGNSSNWDEDVSDLEGYERQHADW